MKKIFSIVLVLLIGFQIGCKKNKDTDPRTPEVIATEALVSTWVVAGGGSVSVDGTDITTDYNGFSISFTSSEDIKTYTVTNGENAFPVAVDTWRFANTTFDSIERGSDLIIMDIVQTDAQLVLKFSTPEPGSGRVAGLFGAFEFVLVKQ